MSTPADPPSDIAERLAALPAAAPLRDAFADEPGVWVVGGAVRDLLLGGQPLDLDLVVEGDAAALAQRLAAVLPGAEVVVHDRFGTATVRAGGHAYDVARARAESYAAPGALPEVRPAGLEEDLARRDFTVNAVAVGLDGRFVSFPGALDDLAARRLRVLHDASFHDDPTRLLRLVRYATRLGFSVESGTAALASAAVSDGALATVTGPRIGRELRLLLRETGAVDGLAWVGSWGAAGVLPGLRVDHALDERALALLPAEGREDLLLLAGAVVGGAADDVSAGRSEGALAGEGGRGAGSGSGEGGARSEGSRDRARLGAVSPVALSAHLDALGFAARDRDTVVIAARDAPRVARRLEAARRPSEVAAALRGAPVELAALAGALGGADAAAAARSWLTELRHVRLEIDGDDLLAAGIPRGEAIGEGLAAALAAKLDGSAVGREAELAAALAAPR